MKMSKITNVIPVANYFSVPRNTNVTPVTNQFLRMFMKIKKITNVTHIISKYKHFEEMHQYCSCKLCAKSFSESDSRVPGFAKIQNKSRRFIKRPQYRKWKKREAMKKPLDLVHRKKTIEGFLKNWTALYLQI